ncbi:alpha/beta fold hydrolase [Nonomuraea jabiensis]|uniref:alpha/beta fold hydrolase n=1 Tax=Nonomuraea jabiensis TaxID=882448 RepID=UPI003D73DBE2
MFDQRNCGRSLPHAGDPAVDLSTNTTQHLIADMERLREHLGVDRWLLYGGSWGSRLMLAYAEAHPARVSEMVICGVTMTRRSEIDWLYRGVGRFFPEPWQRFREGVPKAERDGDLLAAYARLMSDPDPAVRAKATHDWAAWEDAVIYRERITSASTSSTAARKQPSLRPLLERRGSSSETTPSPARHRPSSTYT